MIHKTLGLYFNTWSRVLKNREGTINLFHLSIPRLKVPSTSKVQWWIGPIPPGGPGPGLGRGQWGGVGGGPHTHHHLLLLEEIKQKKMIFFFFKNIKSVWNCNFKQTLYLKKKRIINLNCQSFSSNIWLVLGSSAVGVTLGQILTFCIRITGNSRITDGPTESPALGRSTEDGHLNTCRTVPDSVTKIW